MQNPFSTDSAYRVERTFASSAAYLAATGAIPQAGDQFYNSTTNAYMVYNGGSWVSTPVSAIVSINGDTTAAQSLVVGSAGTDFVISTSSGVTTFDIPDSSGSNRGLLTAADWSTFSAKLSNISIGTFDSQPASSDGLSSSLGIIYAQSADATYPGMVNNTTQTFSGIKTFNDGLDVNSQLITNVLDPVSAQDAATMAYVGTAVATAANRFLSNLSSPTSINQDLLFSAETFNIGASFASRPASINAAVAFNLVSDGDFPIIRASSSASTYSFSSPYLLMVRTRGTNASPAYVNSGDYIGIMGSQTYDGSTVDGRRVAQLAPIASQNHSISAAGTHLDFYNTLDGTVSLRPAARLSSLGQLIVYGASGSNLTLDNGAINFSQIVTPSNPGAGSNLLYFKSDNLLYQKTSAGVESTVGVASIGALDAQAENADGLALVSGVLSTQSADATHPGMVNNTTQTFSGNKTFTGVILGADGSASAPSYASSTTSGTGMSFSGSADTSQVDFYVNGGGFTTRSGTRTGNRAMAVAEAGLKLYYSGSSSIQLNCHNPYIGPGLVVTTDTAGSLIQSLSSGSASAQVLITSGTRSHNFTVNAGNGAGSKTDRGMALNNAQPDGGDSHSMAFFTWRGDVWFGPGYNAPNSFTVASAPDLAGIGNTTANASTTITGVATIFTGNVGVGDRIALSSASSVYSYVTAVSSDTVLTVKDPLGNGTSQSINRKRAIAGFRDASGVAQVVIDDLGNLCMWQPGIGFKVAEGSNARMGTAILSSGTILVSNTSVTANTRIFLTINTPSGTPGSVYEDSGARVPGTSFTIDSTSGSDNSTVAWLLVEPL